MPAPTVSEMVSMSASFPSAHTRLAHMETGPSPRRSESKQGVEGDVASQPWISAAVACARGGGEAGDGGGDLQKRDSLRLKAEIAELTNSLRYLPLYIMLSFGMGRARI